MATSERSDVQMRREYLPPVRDSLHRVLRDGWLVTLSFAVALGFSLYSVAQGANALISVFLRETPSRGTVDDLIQQFNSGALTWRVGDRYITLGPLLGGLIELAVVLAAAALVYRWRDRDADPVSATEEASELE